MITFSYKFLRQALSGLRVLKVSKLTLDTLRCVLIRGAGDTVTCEGFVLKDLYARYEPGAGTTQRKFQFRKSASFIAGVRNPNGRRSVQLFVLRADGSRRDMGFVTIPGSAQMPCPEEIVAVQYLYVHGGPTGKLDQPVSEGVRLTGDADTNDCLETKLKVVSEDE